jgi:hypothetical protein
MDNADWCYGPAQRSADRRYGALQRWFFERHGTTLHMEETVRRDYPALAPALDGLECPALAAEVVRVR